MEPVAGPVVAIVIVMVGCCGVVGKVTGDGIEPQLIPRSEACLEIPLESVTVVQTNVTTPAGAVGSESWTSEVCPGKTPGTCGT